MFIKKKQKPENDFQLLEGLDHNYFPLGAQEM